MQAEQMDMFNFLYPVTVSKDIESEVLNLKKEIAFLTKSLQTAKDEIQNTRKALFARHGDLAKLFLALHREFNGEKLSDEDALLFFKDGTDG